MWKAITEDALSNLLEGAEAEMATPVLAFWEYIRVRPVKWQLPEWGDLGGGFWVVAVLGQNCVWYNDIEEGFNIGSFEWFGRIAKYQCSQSELLPCITWFFESFMKAVDGRA